MPTTQPLSAAPVSLRVISPQPTGAVRRVHLLMRQREALQPLFRMAWDNLADRFSADELEAWAAGVLALADVNAGPSCLVAFWEFSRRQPTALQSRSTLATAALFDFRVGVMTQTASTNRSVRAAPIPIFPAPAIG